VRSEKAVLRWARGQPGTDMSHITIPTHHTTIHQVGLAEVERNDFRGISCSVML
jgi:hypothetical protein